jgi:hypothetical protein
VFDRVVKTLWGFILGLVAPLASDAAEIVAWKVPLSSYGVGGLEAPGVIRCKDAPEPSQFFKQGDELWDLTKAVSDRLGTRKIAPEWLIWNASSRRLVAKGDCWDLYVIQKIIAVAKQPVQCRVVASVFEVSADGAPLSDASRPASESSVVFRSGQRSTALWESGGKSMDLDVEGTIDEDGTLIGMLLKTKVGLPDQPPMKVETAFSCEDGTVLWVARDFDGKKGLDLRIAGTIELMDGSPFRERVMIQKSGEDSPVAPRRREMTPRQIDGKGWLVSINVDSNTMEQFLSPGMSGPGADPFKETVPDESLDLPHSTSVQPPEFLRKWVTHEILDVHDWIKGFDPNLSEESDFAGYDPIEGRIYFFSPNRTSADSICELFTPMCCGPATTVVSTWEGLGQTRLIGKSGSKSTLARILDAKTNTRFLEIEPTVGESGDLVDLRFDFDDSPDPQRITRLGSSTILEEGVPNVLFFRVDGNGAKTSVSTKVEILR